MQILVNKYSQTMKRIDVRFGNITSEELKTCIDCISQFENLTQLNLTFDSKKTTEPIDDCLSLIGQKCNKLLKLDLSINGSDPISDRFLTIFSKFKAIKKLNIYLSHNTVLSGSIECFKHCTELYELDIYYPKLREEFFANIELFVPKLQLLGIKSKEQFSETFINSFHSMISIQKVILLKIDYLKFERKKYYYFGKCLSEMMLSPERKRVKLLNDNCGLIKYN